MAKKHEEIDLETALKERFERWDNIYKNGANDPFWQDGVNLKFVRQHIIHYKSEMEKQIKDGNFPEIYFRETPPEIENSYMARPDEIRRNALKSLETLKENKTLEYIKRKAVTMEKSFVDKTSARSLINSLTNLSDAIEKDDLVVMRRYENVDNLLSEIDRCAKKLQEYVPPENSQMTLFDMSEEDEILDLRL